MSVQETPTELWGGETTKAVANFPVSGETVPLPVVRWLGRIKGTAARVNAELGLLDADARRADRRRRRRDRRGQARRAVPDRRLPDGLGHVVEHELQRGHRDARGRGRASERPREHGPVVQRRLPVRGPSRRARRGHEHAAAGAGAARGELRGQGRGVQGHRQVGAHAPDGRGARHPGPGVRRLRRADPARPEADRQRAAAGRADPARRHRDRHRPQHASRVRREGAREAGRRHRPDDLRARGPVRGAGQP